MLAGRALSEAGLEALGAVRLSEVALQEPDKALVLRYTGQDRQDAAAQGLPREARVLCYGAESGRAYLVRVNLSAARATHVQQLPPMQPRFVSHHHFSTCLQQQAPLQHRLCLTFLAWSCGGGVGPGRLRDVRGGGAGPCRLPAGHEAGRLRPQPGHDRPLVHG